MNHQKKFLVVFWILILLFFNTYGQDNLIKPTVTFHDLREDVPIYKCESFDIARMIEEYKNNLEKGISPLIFAKKFPVTLTPDNSGIWEEKDGLMIWRLQIESERAHSIMLIIEELNLPPYSSLFLYNKDLTYIAGPYTEKYSESKVLPTPLIPGNSLTLELVYQKDLIKTPPSLKITNISHDFVNIFGYLNSIKEDGFAGPILNCHNDINCNVGNPWQIEKRAIARIVVDGNGLCTGALINNDLFDITPYFLSANHCFADDNSAITSVFYFNYESPVCNGGDGQTHHIVSGSQRRAFNANTDFCLLELNARVPSSYQPFFAGWDRRDENPSNGIVIHHPNGNTKKISFDNDLIVPNTNNKTLDLNTYQPFTLWEVDLDDGTTEGGSSGAPLFNSNGRIIGQNVGGDFGCPNENGIMKWYGRFFVSWNTGGNITQRLQDWLDPNNNAPNVISGIAPPGWLHDWVIEWNAPSSQNVNSSIKSIAVGSGNQVFYRGIDNKMHTMYWSNDNWHHDWINGWNAPSYQNINGDVVVGEGNQIIYRGADDKMHTYYWSNGSWHHDWLGGWNAPSNQNVHSAAGSIALGEGNQVFYRGSDNKMHVYYWSNGSWHHDWINGWNAPSNENVSGDIEVVEGHQIVYRGADGKMHIYYWSNGWFHDWLGGWNAPSYQDVSSAAGSIAVGGDKVFYRGSDNKMHVYYWSNGSWHHDWINGWNAPAGENVSGDIDVVEGNQIVYRGADGKMHIYYWSNGWIHDWIETSWQAPVIHNVSGSIAVGGDKVFYRGPDSRCRIYYWKQGFIRSSQSTNNYTMFETLPSPTIPGNVYQKVFDFIAYPNPVHDELSLRIFSKVIDIFTVSLYDAIGMVRYTTTVNDFETTVLRLPNISSGFFILKVQDSKGNIVVQKITKQ